MTPYYADDLVTIYHGDCRDVLPKLDDVSMVLTSPPYGAIRDYGATADNDGVLISLLLAAERMADGAVMMLNTADQVVDGSESGDSFRQVLALMEHGLRLHDTMIYCKDAVTYPNANRYLPAFEYMFVLSRGAPRHFHGIRDRRNKWAGAPIHGTRREADGTLLRPSRFGKAMPAYGLRLNWWLMATASQADGPGDHPARMPMAMATAHVVTWTDPGDVVLDPFMGSGTTLVAAKSLGRHAIGIELEERYCEIAANRCRQEVLGLSTVIDDLLASEASELEETT
jgi:site-specific DNA-methyltransferase (adenine-specific)